MIDVNGNAFDARGGGPGNPVGPLDTLEGGIIYQILDAEAVVRGGEEGIRRCTDVSAMKRAQELLGCLEQGSHERYACQEGMDD